VILGNVKSVRGHGVDLSVKAVRVEQRDGSISGVSGSSPKRLQEKGFGPESTLHTAGHRSKGVTKKGQIG
jgi:hypothetical protein